MLNGWDNRRRILGAQAGLLAGLLLGSGVVHAQFDLQVEIQDGIVTAKARDVPLGELLEEISRQSGLILELDGPFQEPITLELTGRPLTEALQQVLRGQSYVYQRSGSSRGVEGSPRILPGRLWVLSGGLDQEDSPAAAVAPCRPDDLDNPRVGKTADCPGRLEIALSHSDPRVRLVAISELTDGGGAGSAEILAAVALTDDEVAVREEAIFGLGEIGDEAGLAVLQQALADPDHRVREAAIDAVADIGGNDSAWTLAASLNDDDPALREQTIYALGSIGGEVARVLLKQALADEHDFIRQVAEEALEDLVD